ncbi:alcohol dehydrogenase catalytic domain-containing protein, partial [Pasteurella multocida]|uniref:alcohol dehydrogenase catalytic domain-containing protein n=1 Tax=Pasteurella multocida TaxID=747 RepID=UPI002EC26E90|nr:alcohol dehydrogenase catalytic domain-containing protein [Pasteurella multocida]
MRAVVYTGAGGNEVVSVAQRPDPTPHGDEVLVEVRYAGINPADLQQRDGNYPPPPGAPTDVPGLEVAGTVIGCGERVLRLSTGDRVFGLVAGLGFATTVGIAAKARTTLVPLAYAFGLGILAWIVFGLVADRSGESLGMTLLVETLSALTVGGMVALPLALVPVKGLGGHTVWQASRRLWAACYG